MRKHLSASQKQEQSRKYGLEAMQKSQRLRQAMEGGEEETKRGGEEGHVCYSQSNKSFDKQ